MNTKFHPTERQLLYLALLILILCLFGVIGYSVYRVKNADLATKQAQTDAKNATARFDAAIKITGTYKAADGATHYTYNSNQNALKNTNGKGLGTNAKADSIINGMITFTDSVAAVYDIARKQLIAANKTEVQTLYSKVKFLEQSRDSANNVSAYYRDKFLSLVVRAVNVGDSVNFKLSDFDLAYNTGLSSVSYWRRAHKFLGFEVGRKNYITDVSLDDPRGIVTGIKAITINPKEPFFRGSIQTTMTYSDFYKALLVGGSVFVEMRNGLTLTARLQADIKTGELHPVFTAGYSFLNF